MFGIIAGEAQNLMTRTTKVNNHQDQIERRIKSGYISPTEYDFDKKTEELEGNYRHAFPIGNSLCHINIHPL